MLKSEKGKKIIVTHIGSNTCKYHRKIGKTFDMNHLGPLGLCLDLYNSAYPYFLTLLHGGQFSWMKERGILNQVYAQCPIPKGNVHFRVERKDLEETIKSEGIEKKCQVFLEITAVESLFDSLDCGCLCAHKKGEIFEFNQGDLLDHLCPAAFYNMYPTIKTIINSGSEPWKKDGRIYVQCPDNETKIKFEISKEK